MYLQLSSSPSITSTSKLQLHHTMKFAFAAAAVAATSSFVGVHASKSSSSSSTTSTSKSGKGSCSSSPKLEKFCNEEPANFEGSYSLCYQSVIRKSLSEVADGVYHQCTGSGPILDRVFSRMTQLLIWVLAAFFPAVQR